MSFMPLLAWRKLRIAKALSSNALRADAYETIACWWLSLTTFIGVGLNAWLGWSLADPVAALLVVPLVVREGLVWKDGVAMCVIVAMATTDMANLFDQVAKDYVP